MPASDAVLVVGGTGTIGTALVRALAAAGTPHHVTARTPAPGILQFTLDRPTALAVPDDVTTAVVLAGTGSLAACHDDPAGTARTNVDGVTRLVSHLHDHGVHAVVASTNLVFDGSRPDARPDDPPSPTTEYGRQKATMEAALHAADVDATVVRFTKVLGERSLLTRWRDDLLRGHPLAAFHDLPVAPVPADWAASILVRLLDLRAGGTWHASPDRETTYHDLALRLAAALDAPAALVRPAPARPLRALYDAMPRHARMAPHLPPGAAPAPGPDAVVAAAVRAPTAGPTEPA